MVPLLIICFVFVTCFSSSTADVCDEHMSMHGSRMMALMNGTYPSCRDVDFSRKLAVCELGNGDEDTSLYGSTYIRVNLHACPDGSLKKVCYPQVHEEFDLFYTCVCRSGVQITDQVRNTSLSAWEEITPPVQGAYYAICLMIVGGECITREFILYKPIVSGFDLPDSVYTASSTYNNVIFERDARFGDYFVICAWVAQSSENQPWLAITLPTSDYSISGAVFKKRCTALDQFTKRVTISTSEDGVVWQDVIADEDLVYGSDILAGVWFSVEYITRYWKFTVKEFGDAAAAMKCDLIGKSFM